MAVNRSDRISEEMKRRVSDVIRFELRDPNIPMMCTVMSVKASKDLGHAKVYVSILGDDEVQQKAMKALRGASGFVRHSLARTMNLRHSPEIHFELDKSISYSMEIARKLDELDDK